MADPRALGELLRAARERAGFPDDSPEAERCAHIGTYTYDGTIDSSDLVECAELLRLPAVPDAWCAAAGLVPPDVAALAADPARWAAIRADHAATARVVAAGRAWAAADDAIEAADAWSAAMLAAGRAAAEELRAALAALDARDGAAPHPVLGADCPHCGHDTREGAHRALCPHAPRDGAR